MGYDERESIIVDVAGKALFSTRMEVVLSVRDFYIFYRISYGKHCGLLCLQMVGKIARDGTASMHPYIVK